jgi:hypothetical protein
MARLFWGGARSQGVPTTALGTDPEGFHNASGTVGISTSPAGESGPACWSCAPGASNFLTRTGLVTALDTTFYLKVSFYLSSTPPALNCPIMELRSSGATIVRLVLKTDGTLQFQDTALTNQGTTFAGLTTGVWHSIEIKVTVPTAGNGTAACRVDNKLVIPDFNLNVGNTTLNAVRYGHVTSNATGVTVYVDNVAFNDSAGANDNTWPGWTKTKVLTPIATAAVGNWQKPGGATTNMETSLDNTPPVGIADSTAAGDAEKMVRNATATQPSNLDLDVQSYDEAGIAADANILRVQPVSRHGTSINAARTGALEGLSNPVAASAVIAFRNSGALAGTDPAGWSTQRGTEVLAPSVTRATRPRIRGSRTNTLTGTMLFDWMGLYVEYLDTFTPSASDAGTFSSTSAVAADQGTHTDDATMSGSAAVTAQISASDSALVTAGAAAVDDTETYSKTDTGSLSESAVVTTLEVIETGRLYVARDAVSERFAEAVKTSHKAISVIQVLEAGEVIAELDTFTDGGVTLDATAGVRGTLDLVVVEDGTGVLPTTPDDLLAPYGHELRPWRGILFDDVAELVSLGIYRIEEVEIEDTGDMLTGRITGMDRAQKVAEAIFEEAYIVASGALATDVLQDVLLAVDPTFTFDFAETSITLPWLVAEVGDDRWQFCQDIALAIGAEIYFDDAGVCVLRPIPSVQGDAVDAYNEGEVLLSASRTFGRDRTFNRVIVTADSSSQIRGVATDDNENSPTYYYGPFGKKPYTYSSQFITTQAQSDDAASGILQTFLGLQQHVTFASVVDPRRRPSDVVGVQRARAGIASTYVLDSVDLPIGVSDDDRMSAETRLTQDFQ